MHLIILEHIMLQVLFEILNLLFYTLILIITIDSNLSESESIQSDSEAILSRITTQISPSKENYGIRLTNNEDDILIENDVRY